MTTERELALESLIRGLQRDADLEVDMWREVGDAIMGLTLARRSLQSKLLKVFMSLEETSKLPPRQTSAKAAPGPLPDMPYPAYQNVGPVIPAAYPGPGGYPSSSAQAPWPPDLVPRATVPRNPPPQQAPQPQPQPQPQNGTQPGWSLKTALAAASRGH